MQSAPACPSPPDGASPQRGGVGARGVVVPGAGGLRRVGAYLVVNFQGRYLERGGRLEGAAPDTTAGADAYGFDLVADVEAMSPDELVTAVAASDLSSSAGAHPLDEPAG